MVNEVIVISSEAMSGPDAQLGRILMEAFLRILSNKEEIPEYIILYNEAVKLALKSSEVYDHLHKLEERGIKIISCQTCVEYFGIENDIAVGEIDGMVKIQDILLNHQVVTI